MFDLIMKKKEELRASMPSNPEFSAWIEQSDLWCWLYSYFRISGQRVSKSSVVAMLSGELRDNVALSSYAFVKSYKDVYYDMKCCIAMGATLDETMLNRWASLLVTKDPKSIDGSLYRSNNPIIYEWELIPPHFREIRDKLRDILRTAAMVKSPTDPLDVASYVHLELNRLYPYGEDTFAVSSAALAYCILQLGLPVPELSAGDVEYNKIVAKYIDDSDRSAFRDMLERSIYNRLDTVLNLARQAGERDDYEA